MDQVQTSSYQIEPTGGGQEYEHQKIGQLNFHWRQMLQYCEGSYIKMEGDVTLTKPQKQLRA